MRRHTLLALSLAAGLALPVAFPTAAFAISDEERANLASAAMISPATMQAATATALRNLAADRPLTLALDELAGVLLDLGMTDDFKAEFALNLVAAARELAATGAVDGFSAETAGDAAAEAVLVRAQGSSTLVSAIFANASTMAASDPSGLTGTMVLGSFVTASTSPLIRIENQTAVREAAVATMTQTASLETGATRPARPFGAGPNLRGITLVNTYLGGPGRAGNRVLEVVSGSAISPN